MADDETLRRHYARAMREPGSPHVSDDAWESLALGELPVAERTAVMSHVSSCAECREIYRSLRHLEDEARAFDPGVPAVVAGGLSPRLRPWYALAAAAAGLLWAVTVGPLGRSTDYSDDVTRATRPGITVISPAEGANFDRTVAWQPVAGATSYRVVGSTLDGARAFDVANVTGTKIALDSAVALAPGRYYVQVTALRDGAIMAESAPVAFVIAAR